MPRDTNLAPLSNSYKDNALAKDIYQIFIDLFEEYIRPDERDANAVGMPQNGSFELLSRFIESNGLAVHDNGDEAAIRYLYNAWTARNPKRGTHFLRTYLQLLYPNSWAVHQLWHPIDNAEEYPLHADLEKNVVGEKFLTSRIRIKISHQSWDKDYLTRIIPALRSSVPARLVLEVSGYVATSNKFKVGSVVSASASITQHGSAKAVSPDMTESALAVASCIDRGQSISVVSHGATAVQPSKTSSTLGVANMLTITASFN